MKDLSLRCHTLLQVDAFCCVVTQVSEQTEELLQGTEQWFSYLHKDSLQLMESLISQPILQVRCAALQLLQCLATLPWAQERMNSQPGFKEYLLDRSTEHDKDSKDKKYDVIKTLCESPTALEVFGREYHMKLREFVKEGPFFVRTETQVALE